MLLKSQVSLKLDFQTGETARLFEQTSDFHDADLNHISSINSSIMLISIRRPNWVFLSGSNAVDQLTTIFFRFSKPEFSNHWGTDEEICRCMIYDFVVTDRTFALQTGDGGRSGTFNLAGSNVELVTTNEILNLLELT